MSPRECLCVVLKKRHPCVPEITCLKWCEGRINGQPKVKGLMTTWPHDACDQGCHRKHSIKLVTIKNDKAQKVHLQRKWFWLFPPQANCKSSSDTKFTIEKQKWKILPDSLPFVSLYYLFVCWCCFVICKYSVLNYQLTKRIINCNYTLKLKR